jgi:chemotaxis protein CheX
MTTDREAGGTATFTEEQLGRFIIDSTRDVFSTMVMMELRDASPLAEPVDHFHCSISGMVGFAGIYSGTLSIHCPISLACKITSSMLGMECDEIDDDINDALGEIANMLGGGIKHMLSSSGLDVKLSTPTVISGENYKVKSLSENTTVVIPFYREDEHLLVGLTLTREES